MKTMYFSDDQSVASQDNRHQRRAFLMQMLFAATFTPDLEQAADQTVLSAADRVLLQHIAQAVPAIDQVIAQHAPERPLKEINQVDLAIMRLIIFESQSEATPKKVLVDEAVELAKEFGSETSPKFVNGVLGKILFKIEAVTNNKHKGPDEKH